MTMQSASELIEMIRDARELAARWEPDHPQYIEGRFYLTPEQWAAIRKEWPLRPGFNDAQAVWGIPVDIIHPNEQVTLPSGKRLIYSKVMDAFYVFDAAIARDAGLDGAAVSGEAEENRQMNLQDKLAEIIEQHELGGDGCACKGWVGAVPHSVHVAAWLVAAVRDGERVSAGSLPAAAVTGESEKP